MTPQLRTTALPPRGYFVQWGLRDPVPGTTYVVTLERSGGPEGPWTAVYGPGSDQYAVLDPLTQTPQALRYVRPNQLQLYDRHYYRLTVEGPPGTVARVTVETAPDALTPTMAAYVRKTRHEFALSLRLTGFPIVLLKRRTWGARCPKCTDARTKTIVRADCRACWGTGLTDGYWAPHVTKGRTSAGNSASVVAPTQKSDATDSRLWLPDFPQLERDDLVVVLANDRRWRVDQQVQPEIQYAATHQVVTLQELAHDHVVYHLRVDPTARDPLY